MLCKDGELNEKIGIYIHTYIYIHNGMEKIEFKLFNSYRVRIEDLEVFTLLLFLGPKSSFEVFRLLSLRIIRAAANAIVRTLFDPLMISTSHSPQYECLLCYSPSYLEDSFSSQ